MLLDVRGFGESDKPHESASYTLDHIAADVIAVMDAEGIEKAHCYGSSVGALYAFYLAIHYQQRFFSFIFQGKSPCNVIQAK